MSKNRNCFTREERRLKFKYREFIVSELWLRQKEDWYSRHKKKCAKCKSLICIQLHHKVYPENCRYLSLHDNAFVALCVVCHGSYHKKHGVSKKMQTTTNRFIKI